MKRQSLFTFCVVLAMIFGFANVSPALAAYPLTDLDALGISDNDTQVWSLKQLNPSYIAPPAYEPTLIPDLDRQRTSGASAATDLVNWSVLVLIYPNTDADFEDAQGNPQHFSGSLTSTEIKRSQDIVDNFSWLVQDWSAGMASVSLTVRVVTDQAIQNVTLLPKDPPDPQHPSYWVNPSDAGPRLSNELASGSYDSVYILWNPGWDGKDTVIPTGYAGRSHVLPIDEGGFTFTYATGVYLPYDYYYPGEVMVHEWLHGVSGYYRSLGYQVADSDEGDDFGYTQDANGSWAPFYRALMQGNLVTPYKEHSGISDAVWRAGNLRAVNRPLPAQLLSPVYGSYVNLTPQLKWAATDMDYTYLVDVFDVADPITPVYSTATTGNTLGIPDGILTWGKMYEWTVRSARNDVQAPASAPLRFEAPAYVISGNTGVGGVILSYIDGTPKTVTSDGSGNYSIPVPHNWSGTVTPSLAGYTFTPESRTYLQLAADQTAQNYYTTPGTWQTVGAAGFSADAAYKLTLAVENGIPYVAYPDKSVDWKATVKKFDGSNWVTVGVPGFSLGGFYAIEEPISIVVDDGTPYVAYQDHHMGDRITVMKFDGSRWVALQRPGFSTGDYVTDIHLAVDQGTPYVAYLDHPHKGGRISIVQKFKNGAWETVGPEGFVPYGGEIYSLAIQNGTPYMAYQDLSDVNTQRKVGVMKLDAPTGNWIPLGSAVFNEDDEIINFATASFAWDNCTPYASYRNGFTGDKATVKKFSGTDWVTVGPAAFSTVEVFRTSLALDHSTPLVAYDGLYNPYKATVMKFDGSNWITVGPADFSADAANYVSLTLDNGKPFVAFMDWSNGGKATVMKFVGAPGVPDITPPGVDSFTIDPLSASLAIPIKVFTASDSVGVTGYMITEIPIAPAVDDPGWSDTAPSTYSVERSGSYTLYPWAKDAAGHVSALFCSPASVKVDATRPTVDSFTATSPSSSFDIPITAFTASDDTGVTGYKITLSSTAPAAGDPGWSATAPTTFRVGAEGNYTLYPWAKDTAGNVSARYGSPATVQVDLPPYVVSFIVASPASSLDIPIIQFTASDTYGVSGYLITESPTPPAAGDSGWSATAPTTYKVGAEGNYTLYPWAKDTAGNVSDVYDPTPVSVVIHVPVTLIVTNNADRGTGSLRQAIAESSPGDRITFDPSLAGATITLDSTLTIDKSLTIDGSSLASPVTISGADAHRVFYIGGELSSIIVTLDSLTISHGYLSEDGGAGIANQGALNVTNSTLSENSAGSGGAIYNTGILNVTNSTFSGNSAIGNGGGIYNYGAVSVTNSTFSGNSALENGGGIFNAAAATVTNSTLSGNSAGWSGGIYNAYWGTLNYSNTIVANSALGDDIVDLGSSSSKNNLIGTIALGALADNGGPTQTIALPAGSPAIDAGDNAICAAAPVNGLDQRGVARDAFCDIGAYEYVGSPDTLAPTVDLFTATSPSSSLDIPITAFTASDDTGVTGYLITQSSTAPAADDAGWSGTAPTTYSVDEDGSYILYPWAKDAAGNVSALFGSPASVAVDSTPPTVDAGSYHVDEAASVTVKASGHDQGNGPLTYAWDLDNNGSFETPGRRVTFSAANLDGPSTYTIQVQVTDKVGLTASDQAAVDVLNVAPIANLTVPPDKLVQGGSAMLAFSNPFDPGVVDTAAGFLYSYDCTNDGVFELAGAPDASYSCVVPVAGVVTALGRIEDKDGGFTDYTAQVTVLTPLEGIEGLNVQIQDLVDRGVLSDVQGKALSAKLKAASRHLDRGKTRTAINRLHSFTNQVKAMVRRRVLSPAEGQPLIDAANGIIAALRSVARDR